MTMPVGAFTVFFSSKIAGLIPCGTASFSVTLNPCFGNMHLPVTRRIDGPGGIMFRTAFHLHLPVVTLALLVLALLALALLDEVFRAGMRVFSPLSVLSQSEARVFTTFQRRPQEESERNWCFKREVRRELAMLASHLLAHDAGHRTRGARVQSLGHAA
jgi:hypothetical protein